MAIRKNARWQVACARLNMFTEKTQIEIPTGY